MATSKTASKLTTEDIKNLAATSATEPVAQNGADDFENPSVGEVFGGSYPRLDLLEGQVSPLLEYVKDSKVQVENDDGAEMVAVPVARTPEGQLISLPISAIFRKHWKEANVNVGDTFKIKRYVEAIKKRGKGAGNKLKVFAVKVYTRKTPAA